MYYASTLIIDPTQMTQLRRRPTKGFRRLAEIVTANLLATQEEHESFTAFSILQDFNRAFRSIGITDIVTISLDDKVLYDDSTGQDQDDFERAVAAVRGSSTTEQQASFQELKLLLEHQLTYLTVVIRVTIERVHRPKAYPIRVEIHGLDSELQAAAENREQLEGKMQQVFATQASYDAYVSERRIEFDLFIDQLEQAIQKSISVDHILRHVTSNIVRPGLHNTGPRATNQTDQDQSPALGRYDSFDDGPAGDLTYIWLWSQFMYSHNTHVHSVNIVDEHGGSALALSDTGMLAGESPLFDPNISFDAHEALTSMPDLPVENAEITAADAQGSDGVFSWLNGFSFDGDSHHHSNLDTGSDYGGDSGSDGGSSCGSSCGGGGD